MSCRRLCLSLIVFYQLVREELWIIESVEMMQEVDSDSYVLTLLHR